MQRPIAISVCRCGKEVYTYSRGIIEPYGSYRSSNMKDILEQKRKNPAQRSIQCVGLKPPHMKAKAAKCRTPSPIPVIMFVSKKWQAYERFDPSPYL
jgi:hypothetical protein